MSFAKGSRHGLAYVAEDQKGATPDSPSMQALRFTSSTLELSKQGFESAEIRSDRQISDYRHGVQQVGGEVGFELSYAAWDPLLAGALFGDWSTLATASSTGLAANATASAFTGSFSGYGAGDWISTSGFNQATNNGLWRVLGASLATLTVDGPLAYEASGATVSLVRHSRLSAGTSAHSFTLERSFAGLSVDQYHRFTGCMVNSLSLQLNPEAVVSGSLALVGMAASTATASLGTVSPAPTHPPFDAFSGSLSEGGGQLAVVTGVELALENGIAPAYVIGSDSASDLVEGRCRITGTLSAFFQDSTLLDKFIDETETSLLVRLEDNRSGSSHGNLYQIHLPRIKFTQGSIPVNDEGPVIISLPFQALYDGDTGSSLCISRIDAD